MDCGINGFFTKVIPKNEVLAQPPIRLQTPKARPLIGIFA
jgi:hypothetical protein